MAYPDDDDLQPALGGRGPQRGGPGEPRPIFVRRLIALGVGLVFLFIVIFGVKACLDNRKARGFANYASDLGSIVTQTNQLAFEFFNRLQTPPEKSSPLNLQAAIATDRGTAEGLLDRVEGLDTPDDLADAQDELVKSYQLRRDALAGIAEQIPTALGAEGRTEAIDAIAADMRLLLAGDVLFDRAQDDIAATLTEEEIGAVIEDSIFLPEPVTRWLDDDELTLILSAFAADAGECSGTRGLELVGVAIDKTPLVAGSENTAEVGDGLDLTAEISNAGDTDEVDVAVSAELQGPTGVLEGEGAISRIEPGQIQETAIAFTDDPPTGVPLTLEVKAQPVPCETLLDNNNLTYTVTFD